MIYLFHGYAIKISSFTVFLNLYFTTFNIKINFSNFIFLFRYKLNAIVEDETASASFLIFGRLAADLIGLPASNLTHSHEDRFTVPLLMTRIYDIEHIFQVVISNKIEDPYNLSFKVTHIFKQEEISRQGISEKIKLNPFTSTLLHKPLIGNTSKTVKRTLTFGESSVPENDKKIQ